MRSAVYTRISQDATGERAGVSRQLDDCSTLAEQIGATVVAHFDDNDISAFNGKTRPGFEAMLDMLKRGEADTIIVWHPDRLYRSLKDLERLIDIVDSGGIAIRTVNGGDLDLSNSTGRMLARILGSVSRQESEHKGERQRRANQQRRADGRWLTTSFRPFGYTRDGQPFEPEASMVRQAATDVLSGRSMRSIAIAWNQRGITTTRGNRWTNLQLRRVLTNPLYAGLVTYQDKVVGPGDWEPLLDEDTHRGLVAFLSDPSRKHHSAFERKYMGSGVYKCGKCGNAMYGAHPHGPNRSMLYVCKPTAHVARIGAPLDEYVEALVLGWLGDPETQQRVTARLSGADELDIDALHTSRTALQARLDDLAAMFAEGAIDASQLRRGTTELRAQLADVDNTLAELSRRSPVSDLLTAGKQLRKRWDALSPDMKGKVVSEIMTVTVQPARRGMRTFDYSLIDIEWKM
jgi:site-specific DNA recombinase